MFGVKSVLYRLLLAAGFLLAAAADSDELLRGREGCLRHQDFPSPTECCAQPHWINQYTVHRCRYVHSEIDGGRSERGSCSARCGLFRINITMSDRIERVRIFRPRLQTRGVDPAWINVCLKALSYCKPKITQMQGRFVRHNEEMEQCEIAEDIFGDCVQAQMFMHCPRETWLTSTSCKTMRELLVDGCPYKSLGDVVILDDEGHVQNERPYDEDGYDRPYRNGRTERPHTGYDNDYDEQQGEVG